MKRNKGFLISRKERFESEGISRKRFFYLRYRKTGAAGVLLTGVVFAFFLQLILANSLATRGGEINELEKQREQLVYTIAVQEDELSQLQSIARVNKLATEQLGMKYNQKQFEYFGHLEYAFDE